MDVIDAFWEVDFGRSVHWRVPFMSLDGTPYQVDIYEEGYQGSVVAIKGGAQPFVTEEIEDEDAFLPLRTSSGYITIVCEDAALVDAILPNEVHDRYVELVDVTPNANKVVWNGYILPEEFSNDWNTTPFELQLPVASPIAACQDLRYSGFFKAVTIGAVLKNILYNQLKVAPTYIMSGKFPNQTASMLTAMFSDIQFAELTQDSQSPAFGTGQNIGFGDEYSTVGDVLEAFCKLYGYVIHETPDALWFCSSDMSLDYYQTEMNYNPTASYVASESVVTLTDASMPDVMSAQNSRALLPGKSKVRVYCEAQEVGEILSGAFDELEQTWYYSNRNSVINYDEGFHSYIRKNRLGQECHQYDNDSPGMFSNGNMLATNVTEGQLKLYGANFFSYAKWKKPDYVWKDEYDKYKNVIMLARAPLPADSSPYKLYAILNSDRAYSAINFVKNGLYIDMTAVACKVLDDLDFKYKYIDSLHFRLIWGGYYFVPTRHASLVKTDGVWQQNPENNVMSIKFGSGDASEPEGVGIMTGIAQGWQASTFGDTRDIHVIPVKPENAADINGIITLEILSFYCANQTDVKYVWLQDLKVRNCTFKEESLGDNTDHFLSDFRRSLSNAKAEEYEYEMPLNNMMADYSPSGVIPPATVQDTDADYFEQTILSRLADWFDRTIEQLTVTVAYSTLNPGQRVVRGNDVYIVVSRADSWRDGMVTLTLQKMYEQT